MKRCHVAVTRGFITWLKSAVTAACFGVLGRQFGRRFLQETMANAAMMRFMNEVESKNYFQVHQFLKTNVVASNQGYLGVYPMNLAIENGDPDMVAILLAAGAPPDAKGNRIGVDKNAVELATAMKKKGKFEKEMDEILELLDSAAKDKKKLVERYELVQVKVKAMEKKDMQRSAWLLAFCLPALAAFWYYMVYIAPTIK